MTFFISAVFRFCFHGFSCCNKTVRLFNIIDASECILNVLYDVIVDGTQHMWLIHRKLNPTSENENFRESLNHFILLLQTKKMPR